MTTDFDSYTLNWAHFEKYPIKDYEPFFSKDKNICPFFVDENFLSPSACDSIANKLFLSNRTDTLRYAYVYNSPKDSKHSLDQRRTHILQMPDDLLQLYQRKFRLVEEKINDYFNIKIIEHEDLQVLGYGIGCKFDMHCDNSTYSTNKDQEFYRWKLLLPKRKLTSVAFISDYADPLTERNQYNGGEFEFKYVLDKYGNPVKLTPKKGTIVSFPSHPYFMHVVNEVKKGYRITLTNWYDVEKLD